MKILSKPKVYKHILLTYLIFLTVSFNATHITYGQESIFIPVNGFVENLSHSSETNYHLDVIINIFKLGENIDTVITQTNADGSFLFGRIPGGVGFGYIITVEHDGAIYKYESDYPLTDNAINIPIYDSSSTNFQDISINSQTLVVTAANSGTEQIKVIGLVELENVSSLTFIPNMKQASNMEFLRFSLPENIMDLDVQSSLRGGQILQVDLGFAITTPLPPGKHEIAYTFISVYDNGEFSFQHSLPLGANQFRILIPNHIGSVNTIGLTTMQDVNLGENKYNGVEAKNLQAGTKTDISFKNLPQPSLLQQTKNALKNDTLNKWIIPIVMAIILLSFLSSVIYQLRNRKNSEDKSLQATTKEDLVKSIVYIEEQFSSGNIQRNHYVNTRKQLLDQLIERQTNKHREI